MNRERNRDHTILYIINKPCGAARILKTYWKEVKKAGINVAIARAKHGHFKKFISCGPAFVFVKVALLRMLLTKDRNRYAGKDFYMD
jgi:hypothetical protein